MDPVINNPHATRLQNSVSNDLQDPLQNLIIEMRKLREDLDTEKANRKLSEDRLEKKIDTMASRFRNYTFTGMGIGGFVGGGGTALTRKIFFQHVSSLPCSLYFTKVESSTVLGFTAGMIAGSALGYYIAQRQNNNDQ